MQRSKADRLVVGDRVTEQKVSYDHVIDPSHPNYGNLNRIIRNNRKGIIQEVKIIKNKRGAACKYAMVLWDGYQSLSQHAVNRLHKLEAN
tara:strand:- start:5135 stop:5404 length:270 start_codon:yes stop_codon:yes gene_type:complete